MPEPPWPIAPPIWMGGTAIWLVPLVADAARFLGRTALLSPEEWLRADRFLRAVDRDRFVASHAALRLILGGALGLAPAAVPLAVSSSGKLHLGGAQAGRLQFNLSHSGSLALVGLAKVPIGVDIEAIRPLPDALAIARGHFHPSEVAAIAAQPSERQQWAFYGCWTRKEAFVKALGAGLAIRLDRFTVSVPPAPAALLDCAESLGDPDGWTLHHLAPESGAIGAVAIAQRDAPCTRHRLASDWITHL